MAEQAHSNKKARAISGLAALTEMLSLIGKEGATDHDMAKVFTEHELDFRALASMFMDEAL